MPIRTLVVNTMPPGQGEDPAGRNRNASSLESPDPPDQPDRYLDHEAKRRLRRPGKLTPTKRTDDIPPGMEGFYYLP
jgi:hypothetical protein